MTEYQIVAATLRVQESKNMVVVSTVFSEAIDHLSLLAVERGIPIDKFLKSHPAVQLLSYKLRILISDTTYPKSIADCRILLESNEFSGSIGRGNQNTVSSS